MSLRARLVALGVALAVLLAAGIVTLVTTRTPQCGVVAPRPSLPSQLRALGDFDQGYDAGNTPLLQDAAARAAGALHPNLIGTTPETPVPVRAARSTEPDAVVVPLRAQPSSTAAAPLAALVVFLRDCAGTAFYSAVEDDSSASPPVQQFPAVTRDQAVAALGDPGVSLAYANSPLQPVWTTTASPPRTMSAR